MYPPSTTSNFLTRQTTMFSLKSTIKSTAGFPGQFSSLINQTEDFDVEAVTQKTGVQANHLAAIPQGWLANHPVADWPSQKSADKVRQITTICKDVRDAYEYAQSKDQPLKIDLVSRKEGALKHAFRPWPSLVSHIIRVVLTEGRYPQDHHLRDRGRRATPRHLPARETVPGVDARPDIRHRGRPGGGTHLGRLGR